MTEKKAFIGHLWDFRAKKKTIKLLNINNLRSNVPWKVRVRGPSTSSAFTTITSMGARNTTTNVNHNKNYTSSSNALTKNIPAYIDDTKRFDINDCYDIRENETFRKFTSEHSSSSQERDPASII